MGADNLRTTACGRCAVCREIGMADQHLRQIFAQNADKYGRLNLTAFLTSCKDVPSHSQNHCCTVAADRSLPHTQSWSGLKTAGRTAQEKRELAAAVESLRRRVIELEPLEPHCAQLSKRSEMLQQSNEFLEAELLKLRAEVKAEREWLEGQLDHQVSTHQQQQ